MDWKFFVAPFEDETLVPEEWLIERIRNWRNKELSSCDWTQVSDAPVDSAAWSAYRQALRDLPQQSKDPRQLAFPVKP